MNDSNWPGLFNCARPPAGWLLSKDKRPHEKIYFNNSSAEFLFSAKGKSPHFHREYWKEIFSGLDYKFSASPPHIPSVAFAINHYDRVLRTSKKCIKIFATEEMTWPSPHIWDYAFSLAPPSQANFHLIAAAFFQPDFDELLDGNFSATRLKCLRTPKTRFCNFVYHNAHWTEQLAVLPIPNAEPIQAGR